MYVEAYDRTGTAVACIDGLGVWGAPTLSYLAKDRIAIACAAGGFSVHGLRSGQLQGLVNPGVEDDVQHPAERLHDVVAADKAGLRGGVLEARTHVLRVYDAVTLVALVCLQPGSPGPAPDGNYVLGLLWGAYAWLLHSCPVHGLDSDCELHSLLPRPGSNTYEAVMEQQLNRRHRPALSRDGAFWCTCTLARAAVEVCDVRSEALVLKHVVQALQPKHKDHYAFGVQSISWSICGRRILVSIVEQLWDYTAPEQDERVYSHLLLQS